MRHIGFLVVGSEFALDSEEKDLEIPLLLKSEQETETLFSDHVPQHGLFSLNSPLLCRTHWKYFQLCSKKNVKKFKGQRKH